MLDFTNTRPILQSKFSWFIVIEDTFRRIKSFFGSVFGAQPNVPSPILLKDTEINHEEDGFFDGVEE